MIAECVSRREDAVCVVELEAGLSAEEADSRVARAHRAGDIGARALAFYLADLADRDAHQQLGYHSIEQYAETRYHISPPTTRCYLATGRALQELPEINRAFGRGGLFWSQVRELVRLATPETEAEWLQWAVGRTAREIAAQARIRRKGERPTDPARRRIHEVSFRFAARMNALQWVTWGTAREKLEAELGRPVSDTEMMDEAARLLLSTRPDGSVAGRMPVNDSHYQLVAIRDRETGTATLDVDGVPFELDEDENTGPEVPRDERDVPTPPALRRQVLARDRFRCLSCQGRKNLTSHHKKWRRHGGRTVLENEMTTCEDCHSLIHAGLLVVRGTIPENLRFKDRRGHDLRTLAPEAREVVEAMEIEPPGAPAPAPAAPHALREPVSRETPCRSLDDFVGQKPAVSNLKRAAARARRCGEPLPHILLCGPPGLGKTSLARAAAAEAGASLRQVSAPMVRGTSDLLGRLEMLRDREVLFIDEIHRLAPGIAEALYEAMERPPFALIGATTDEDLLPAALISRFAIRQDLSFYSIDELTEILRRAAGRFELAIDEHAVRSIARASRETPREALRLLAAVRDEAELRGIAAADCGLVMEVLDSLEIDECGLGRLERAYLDALRSARRPLGLGTLADRLGKTPGALLRVHEPFLVRRGLVARTIQGRVLTTGSG